MRSDFLREDFKPGDPVRKVAGARQARRIARVLNDIQGIGCRIEKPKNAEGYGWRVILDGSSDLPYPPNMTPPFGGSSSPADYSKYQHGFSISGEYISLLEGDVKHYGALEVTTPAAQFLLQGTQYFYVHYERTGSSEWRQAGAKPGATQTSSVDVYCFKFVAGVLINIGHLGDILFDLPLA
jgi:hypothetical protein